MQWINLPQDVYQWREVVNTRCLPKFGFHKLHENLLKFSKFSMESVNSDLLTINAHG